MSPTTRPNEIPTEIIDVHGYLTVAAYIHYFLPGSLKIYTKLYAVHLGQLGEIIDRPHLDLESAMTRRIHGSRKLPKTEIPYPGYCRAPGSAKCMEIFCNCKALDRQWEKLQEKRRKKKNQV